MQHYVSPNLDASTKLWRYMSLDKFIDLLATNEIFFTPLRTYSDTDPFEGLLPKVALQPLADFTDQKLNEYIEELESTQAIYASGPQKDLKKYNELSIDIEQARNRIFGQRPKLSNLFFNIMNSFSVNCWHNSAHESEGMWRIYSEQNKGVAICTDVASLMASINSERRIILNEVKYIDFYDPNLTVSDCTVNGLYGPYIKRLAFSHEKEVRLALPASEDAEYYEAPTFESSRIKINPMKLIKWVYISPYAPAPYPNAVQAIAEKYGIEKNKIKPSRLLQVDESLTRLF